MKIFPALTVTALATLLTGCASTPAPQAFQNPDASALVIQSVDGQTSQILQPTPSNPEPNGQLLQDARKLPQHQTVVVILENYSEPQLGHAFRERCTPWFISLRGLGYQHIYFLQGRGVPTTEGLPVLAEYN